MIEYNGIEFKNQTFGSLIQEKLGKREKMKNLIELSLRKKTEMKY